MDVADEACLDHRRGQLGVFGVTVEGGSRQRPDRMALRDHWRRLSTPVLDDLMVISGVDLLTISRLKRVAART